MLNEDGPYQQEVNAKAKKADVPFYVADVPPHTLPMWFGMYSCIMFQTYIPPFVSPSSLCSSPPTKTRKLKTNKGN